MRTATVCLLAAVTVAASAIASTPPAPAAVAVSSSTVEVHQPRLSYENGAWQVTGCLVPRRGVQPRLTTHLDVVCLDSAGAPVAAEVVPLKASALRFRARTPLPHVRFALPAGFVMPATARIEVRAHD